jgi:hypothetical protein
VRPTVRVLDQLAAGLLIQAVGGPNDGRTAVLTWRRDVAVGRLAAFLGDPDGLGPSARAALAEFEPPFHRLMTPSLRAPGPVARSLALLESLLDRAQRRSWRERSLFRAASAYGTFTFGHFCPRLTTPGGRRFDLCVAPREPEELPVYDHLAANLLVVRAQPEILLRTANYHVPGGEGWWPAPVPVL